MPSSQRKPAAFDPTTSAADAFAVFVDTSSREVQYDFMEAGSLIARVRVVRAFIPGIRLHVAKSVAESVAF